MTDNIVIDRAIVAVHASAALLSLTLGAAQLLRRRYGDRLHRRLGRVWVAAMYLTLISSLFITGLRPGQYTLFHALSFFTFGTLTTGLVAILRGNVGLHLRMMTGSWFGVVGAFVGAVAVPKRTIPQLAVHAPWLLAGWVAAVALTTYLLVSGRVPGRRSSGRPAGCPPRTPVAMTGR